MHELEHVIGLHIHNRMAVQSKVAERRGLHEASKERSAGRERRLGAEEKKKYETLLFLVRNHPPWLAEIAARVAHDQQPQLVQLIVFAIYADMHDAEDDLLLLQLFGVTRLEVFERLGGVEDAPPAPNIRDVRLDPALELEKRGRRLNPRRERALQARRSRWRRQLAERHHVGGDDDETGAEVGMRKRLVCEAIGELLPEVSSLCVLARAEGLVCTAALELERRFRWRCCRGRSRRHERQREQRAEECAAGHDGWCVRRREQSWGVRRREQSW